MAVRAARATAICARRHAQHRAQSTHAHDGCGCVPRSRSAGGSSGAQPLCPGLCVLVRVTRCACRVRRQSPHRYLAQSRPPVDQPHLCRAEPLPVGGPAPRARSLSLWPRVRWRRRHPAAGHLLRQDPVRPRPRHWRTLQAVLRARARVAVRRAAVLVGVGSAGGVRAAAADGKRHRHPIHVTGAILDTCCCCWVLARSSPLPPPSLSLGRTWASTCTATHRSIATTRAGVTTTSFSCVHACPPPWPLLSRCRWVPGRRAASPCVQLSAHTVPTPAE
jgi:hypothetical protein